MSDRTASRLAWSVFAMTVVSLALTGTFANSVKEDVPFVIAFTVFVLVFATVGALVASRQPHNPLGWIMCGAGIAYAALALGDTYAQGLRGASSEDALPGSTYVAWVSSWGWVIAIGPPATFLLLLFPSGRLPSPRWRPVAWLAAGSLAACVVGGAFAPGRLEDFPIDNPVGVSGAEVVAGIGLLGVAVAIAGSIASLFARYRRGTRQEVQQLKWLMYAAGVVGSAILSLVLLSVLVTVTSDVTNAVVTAAVTAIPAAIGIAILRHGLYDIDLVINRTLVYGALTATLAASYLGLVLLLQIALNPLTEASDLAIAGSTLAVAALFRPARRWIQELVDRRFFRRKYDAALTLERFGTSLRDEVDLDALGGELRRVVADTMQPASVSLWLRAPRAQR